VSTAAAEWDVWSTRARLVVTDPAQLEPARRLVTQHLADVDAACSRFRACSELRAVEQADGQPVVVTALLARLVAAALEAAERTDGDVDPTVGSAMDALGYDRDIALAGADEHPVAVLVHSVGWRRVRLDGSVLTLPRGAHLDLGATAKAVAADRGAELVAAGTGCGVLLSLGGDIATAGPAPAGGWQVLVQDTPTDPACRVAVAAGGAVATSSTVRRSWSHGGRTVHHIVDPRTGLPAPTRWRSVTVAATTCLEANTVTTACVVRGDAALRWLRELGLPARLVDDQLRVHTLNGWPAEPGLAA
jgi:thiamine biosynthesis lipoprotein